MTRLPGSGTVPRVLALLVVVIMGVFFGVQWRDPSVVYVAIPAGGFALAMLVRSLFVGVFLDRGGVIVRSWFRNYRYSSTELTAITVIPYWRFLDPKDPILSLLKFTPTEGWVREFSATVSWKSASDAQAAQIRRHLGIEPT